jgi:hypothetical protein
MRLVYSLKLIMIKLIVLGLSVVTKWAKKWEWGRLMSILLFPPSHP